MLSGAGREAVPSILLYVLRAVGEGGVADEVVADEDEAPHLLEVLPSGGEELYFALACCVSYMLSGYTGLYSSQKIMYSKLRPEFIDINAK